MSRLAAPGLGTNTVDVTMWLPLTSVDSGPGSLANSDGLLTRPPLPSLLLGPGA